MDAEAIAAGEEAQGHRAGRCRPRQRRRPVGHAGRRHGRQRADVEHHLGRRARHRAAARHRPQHRPGQPGAQGRCVEAQQVLRRRAAGQDRRRRRPGPDRRPRGRAAQGLRDDGARLRPVHVAGQGRPARRPARGARRAARRVGLHHGAPAQDARDRRSHRRGGAQEGQADGADRQRGARWHRRRAGARRRDPRGSGSRRRSRRLRQGADHRVAAVRVRVGRRDARTSAPRRRRPRRRPASPWPGRSGWRSAATSSPTR